MKVKKYKVVITQSGKQDIKNIKAYILFNFKYRELGETFSKKIKTAALDLNIFPSGYDKIGLQYRGYDI